MIAGERLEIAFLLEVMGLALRAPEVDSILSQVVSKFSVDGFHHLSPGRDCWRRYWVSGLFDRRYGSSRCCFMLLVGCALKHPNSFDRQVPQVPHMLVVICCVRGDVCRGCHDRSFLGFGQQICFIEIHL
jgi:hypothetical protein